MQMNITTDYAIRAILYLAEKDKLSSTAEIAEAVSIPHSYVPAIMKKLKDAEIAKVTRGVKGGWALAKDPNTITLYDIIITMENTIKINRCLEEDGFCNRTTPSTCAVHGVYNDLQNYLESELKKVKVTDVID